MGDDISQGKTYIVLKVNEPPRDGTCAITPTEVTFGTPMSMSCTNWLDSSGIQEDYTVYCELYLKII